MMIKSNALILSTDSLSNYGLDLIFSIVKESGLDGIDLAMRKGFDARNEEYVKKLSFEYDLPIYAIQTSEKVNQKEMEKALDLCATTGATTICLNAPKITEFKVYDFITGNLEEYKNQNTSLNFAIINPRSDNDGKYLSVVPKFHFSSVIDIIKKHSSYVGLDISNLDTDQLEEEFMRGLDEYIPYLSIVYLSDKDKKWHSHLIPGDWDLNLAAFLKKLRKVWYSRPVSIKVNFTAQDLINREKLIEKLKKIKEFYTKYFLEEKVDIKEDDEDEETEE